MRPPCSIVLTPGGYSAPTTTGCSLRAVPKDASRTAAEQAKRERRLERQRQEAATRHRAARRRKLRNVAASALLVTIVIAGAYLVLRPDPEVAGVTRPAGQGRGHVAGATYDSATPTSGRHNASSPTCGAMNQSLEPDLAVHALEHGTVIVWHRPDIDDELRARATDLLREWDSHWILSPNPGIDQPFVATAWNRLKAFDEPTEDLREFVDTYRRRGPERVDCPA